MRVRLFNGRIVTLRHFRPTWVQIDLLRRLQVEAENLPLQALADNGSEITVRCFDLDLDLTILKMLNPF